MVQQFKVICNTFSTVVWDVYVFGGEPLAVIDAEYSVDAEKYQYQYEKGENAELAANWRERCAIEAHYHANNAGSYVFAVPTLRVKRGNKRKVSDDQIALPFDDMGDK